MARTLSERDLYAPVKAFLEGQGYTVKGEVEHCDVVAVRDEGEPPVIVELKAGLTFALILQAVDRLALSDRVYVAFRVGKKHSSLWRSRRRQVIALLRRLGLGLLTVSTRGNVVPVLDPVPYRPRGSRVRTGRLLREFFERVGDPEVGGSATGKRLTSYRQDALRCVRCVHEGEVCSVAEVRESASVDRAGTIMRDNHYGWFERERRGHYRLTPKGTHAVNEWADALKGL